MFASNFQQFHVSIVHWIVLTVIATYVMQKTGFGNWVYATGGNAQTARLAGVPVARVKMILFVCTALAAACSGDQRDADVPERQHHARLAICLHRHRRAR